MKTQILGTVFDHIRSCRKPLLLAAWWSYVAYLGKTKAKFDRPASPHQRQRCCLHEIEIISQEAASYSAVTASSSLHKFAAQGSTIVTNLMYSAWTLPSPHVIVHALQ